MLRVEGKSGSLARLVDAVLSVDRFAYLGVAATTLIALLNLVPWIRVPGTIWYGDDGTPQVVALVSIVEWSWRAVGLIVAFTIALLVVRRSWAARRLRTLAIGYFFFLLCFPSALSYFEPELLARGRSVFWGVERTVADMEYNLFHQHTAWRRFQTFSADALTTVEDSPSPGPDLGWNVLHPAQWLYFVGYYLALPLHVLQSMSLAPLFALFASIALIVAVQQSHSGHADAPAGARDMRGQFCAMSVLMLLFLLGPKVVSSWAYARADEIAGQGSLLEIIAYLEQAIRFDPPQRFSLPVVARLGRKYRDANLDDEVAAFASRTFDLMRRGKHRAALAEIAVGRLRHPNDASLGFFESVALEEAGRAAFDQGQTTEALRYWRASQSTARLSPFSLYGESLAELRNDDTEAAARALASVLALQQSIGFKRLTVGGQAHLLEAWRLLRQRKAPGEIHAAFALAYQPDQW